MADAVTVNRLFPPAGGQASTVIVRLTNLSDGTGETAVKKVDITTVLNYFGVQPIGLRIEVMRWAVQGFSCVTLAWDRTAGANTAAILPASGYEDLTFPVQPGGAGGAQDFFKLGGVADPSAGNADNKGSILLTTNGTNASGNSYDITLVLRCEPNQS